MKFTNSIFFMSHLQTFKGPFLLQHEQKERKKVFTSQVECPFAIHILIFQNLSQKVKNTQIHIYMHRVEIVAIENEKRK